MSRADDIHSRSDPRRISRRCKVDGGESSIGPHMWLVGLQYTPMGNGRVV